MSGNPTFECPVCGYKGPFRSQSASTGNRKYARCPNCCALERHRLQKLVFESVTRPLDLTQISLLHLAPENVHERMFRSVGQYTSADLSMSNVDYHYDLQQRAPFDNNRFDIVFASHVLEHVPKDDFALKEIARILRPGGLAFLPVPIVVEKTIEYPEPNPFEEFHVRAPGSDYFDRFSKHFVRVDRYDSSNFDEHFQLYLYEDRTIYPTTSCPWRTPTSGERHLDYVPVCYA